MKKFLPLLLIIATYCTSFAQNVGIGSTSFTPVASALLEMRSTTSGLLLPRMTQVQMGAIAAPAEGLLVYQNNGVKGFKYFDGSAWVPFGGAGAADNFGNHIAAANIQLNDFWLSNDGDNEGIRIANNGNVGIGIALPTERLHVNAGSGDAHILISSDPSNSNDSFHPKLLLSQDGGTVNGWFGFETEGGSDNVVFVSNDWMDDAGDVRVRTQGTSRMTIEGTGNVGIGTTSPQRLLNVEQNTGAQILLTRGDSNTLPGEVLGELIFDSTDDTAPSAVDGSGVIRVTASEYHGNSNKGGNMSFLTKQTGSGSGSVAQERLTITNTGNIGIGVTAPVAKLHTTGTVRMEALAGAGSRMVVADNLGNLSTQALPQAGLWSENGANVYRPGGNVGIGTSTPSARFEIVNDGGTGSSDDISVKTYTNSLGPVLSFQASRGSESSPSNLVNGDNLGTITFKARASGAHQQVSYIHAEYAGDGNTRDSDLRFATSAYEHVRIDEIGRMSIGTGVNTSVRPPLSNFHMYGRSTSGFLPGGTSGQPSPSTGPEIGFAAGGFYNGLAATIQLIDYDGYSGGLAFNVHRGVYNGAGGSFADNWPLDVIQAMTIVNNGNIGVGTTDPQALLDVNGSARVSSLAGAGTRMVVANAQGDLSTQAVPSGGGSSAYGVNGTGTQSTSSSSFSNVNSMSLSLTAGTYILQFNAEITADNSSSLAELAFYANGAVVSGSERTIEPDNAEEKTVTVTHVVTVSSTQTVTTQFRKSSGSGTISLGNRCFTAIRL